MRRAVVAGLMAVGMLAGCGGTEADLNADETALQSREDALPFCGNQSYWIDYYSDATYTTPVGYMYCECYQTAWIGGRRTAYAVTDYASTCG